jgi:CheY-like chemotaxis protein
MAEDPKVSDRPIRLLVADDDPLYRSLLTTVADRVGNVTVHASVSSGAAVLEADLHDVDAVILDISMPGGGIATCEKLRGLGFERPILLVTAAPELLGDPPWTTGATCCLGKWAGAQTIVTTARDLTRGSVRSSRGR